MSEPPSGTIAFLFTDIEGSTRRWEDQPEAMAAAVALHDSLLRGTIESHGGIVFKTVGDAVCAAFPVTAAALSGAVAIQHRLTEQHWGDLDPIRVRIAIHAGAAERRDDDYFGPTLNRTARLLSAAHGGQILLSRAAYELARDTLPAEVTLRDLGEHRLKDLPTPERIVQASIASLSSVFPPPRTLDTLLRDVPIPPTPIIGRHQEIKTAIEILEAEGGRLLTLTGPGGTGKTRLSLELATMIGINLNDGVRFVPLADVSDPALVPAAIAQALPVRESAGQPLRDLVIEELRQRELLLVLDNFEQVVEAAPFVAELLTTCPKVKILITTRTRLLVRGERELPVPPLAVPAAGSPATRRHSEPESMLAALAEYDAVRLFVERAQVVRPDFMLTSENATAVAEVCTRLDGLPLGIELAAARVRLLTPQAMAAQLDRSLDMLGSGPRDLPDRQRTMRGAIAWSYSMLPEAEQRLFARLSVCVGGCSLDGAMVLSLAEVEASQILESTRRPEIDFTVLDGLEKLVDHSLIRAVEDSRGESRYDLLETIRAFGLERLVDLGENESSRYRHAWYALRLAEQAAVHLEGPEQATWLDRLEIDHGNLRAALTWFRERNETALGLRLAGALWRFWWIRGHFGEGRSQLETFVALTGSSEPSANRAVALNGAGVLADSQGDYERAASLYREGLDISRALGDRRAIAWALNCLGGVALQQGDDMLAEALLRENLDVATAADDRASAAVAMTDLGRVAHQRGDVERAVSFYEQSLVHFRALGDESNVARALNNLGVAMLDLGDHHRAAALLQETLALRQAVGDKQGTAQTLNNLAEVAREQGDAARAKALYGESWALSEEIGDRLGAAIALENLGAIARRHAEPDAPARYGDALRLYRTVGDWLGVRSCLRGLAMAATDDDRLAEAAQFLGLAAAIGDRYAISAETGDTDEVDAVSARLRAALGDEAYRVALTAGAAMSIDAVATEFRHLTGSPTGSER